MPCRVTRGLFLTRGVCTGHHKVCVCVCVCVQGGLCAYTCMCTRTWILCVIIHVSSVISCVCNVIPSPQYTECPSNGLIHHHHHRACTQPTRLGVTLVMRTSPLVLFGVCKTCLYVCICMYICKSWVGTNARNCSTQQAIAPNLFISPNHKSLTECTANLIPPNLPEHIRNN